MEDKKRNVYKYRQRPGLDWSKYPFQATSGNFGRCPEKIKHIDGYGECELIILNTK